MFDKVAVIQTLSTVESSTTMGKCMDTSDGGEFWIKNKNFSIFQEMAFEDIIAESTCKKKSKILNLSIKRYFVFTTNYLGYKKVNKSKKIVERKQHL